MASPAPATTQQEQQPPPLDVDELLKCGTPKPLQFIVTDEKGMFYVDPNTAKIITAIKKPLVVVSIVGKYRTGKSFFMNRLAGSNTGFSLGRTIKAQTKGIWVWPRPHPDNDKYLLLLDTEGLGDVHKGDEHHDMWIFVMAVLMSTTLVWNIMGVLDHQSFEQLNFITNMTEHVQTKKTQTEDEQKLGLHNYFPNFIVCIRDFTLELEINSTPCTSDEYLEDCLNAPELENLRKQREMLRTCFKNRKCFVFKRPVEEELINTLENVPDDELRPVFLDTANRFKEYVLQTSTVKQVDSVTLTGHSFLTLVEEYVNSSNNPKFKLCIESTLTHVVNTSNKRAKDEAIEFYNKKMESVKTRFPLPVQELCKLHEDCFHAAMELFNENSVLDREKTHRKELKPEPCNSPDIHRQQMTVAASSFGGPLVAVPGSVVPVSPCLVLYLPGQLVRRLVDAERILQGRVVSADRKFATIQVLYLPGQLVRRLVDAERILQGRVVSADRKFATIQVGSKMLHEVNDRQEFRTCDTVVLLR
ncbi:guanylate-binding protein 3-like [Petromyzon marinus]|uniref:guanylate-binding protein 3-like n=1 Tax=Petromyzon marinus TaxID=7757 RepID=UPI003F723929